MKLNVKYFYDDFENIIIEKENKEYKFIIKKQEATVIANDYDNIEEIVEFVRRLRPHIYKFHSPNNTYYQEFDIVYSFKLPIKIIQPSKFFIDKNIVDEIGDTINEENMYFPVQIINDEYVLLDGHTLLYSLNQNYVKMVNVYISDYKEYIPDFVYIAKENNIKSIDKLDLVNHDDYNKYWNEFLKQFNIIND